MTAINTNDVRGRITQYINCKFGLWLADRFEYEEVVGRMIGHTPVFQIPGRGIAKIGKDMFALQIALCLDEPNAEHMNIALQSRFKK